MIITKNMTDAKPTANKDLWATPPHIYNPLNDKYKFTLDPCCLPETAKCPIFYTPKENGLIQSWAGHSVFANPPYSRGNIDQWVKKFFNESLAATVVALLPVSTSADWFQNYCISQTKFWVDKRIRFMNAPFTAPFSSVIILFNHIDESHSFKQ